jgi:ATP-dependent helicase/nuclease subunit B
LLTLHSLIEQDLEGGATVVTPSPQRAAAVRLAYATARIARGERAWRTPDVVALRAWLERELLRAADAAEPAPRPLRPAEEWLLWKEAALDAAQTLLGREEAAALSSGRLADSLSRAARLMFDWGIPPGALRGSGGGESELLARALERVEARSHEAHAAPSHALWGLLRGSRARPASFAGFTERSAARAAWMQAASERLPAMREHLCEGAQGRAFTARASDPAEELELAAEWCRVQLGEDPERRLLVIVPDLPQRRSEAVQLFEQALAPRLALSGSDEEAGRLAVEGGEPLAGYPLVRHGLTALAFLTGTLDVAKLSAWLRASFWRVPQPPERAELDAWLREVLAIDVTPAALQAALQAAPRRLGAASATLRGALGEAARALGPPAEAAPTREWAQRFERSLEALGWPGARSLSSAEQQTKARFEEILADFVGIGGQLGPLGAPQALRMLEALAARTTFAPESGDAPVTLTGALTDPVVRYDGIWVAGLHADAWPPPPAANPFIPLSAQIRAGIPGVTAAGSLARARGLLDRWRRSAPQLVASWAASMEDRQCAPSPLLAELDGIEPWTPDERSPTLARRIRATRRIESFADDAGTPWAPGAPLPTGTRALDYQSRCPFRSYAELRLSSTPLQAPRPGVDPRERGRLVHRALEYLWREIGGSEGLQRASTSGGLERLIEECVARAARESFSPPSSPSAAALQRRERRRITRLLLDLTALESGRAPFRVSALEQTRSLTLAGARLDVRIDRIDELDDGARVILDYKTGKPAPLEWLAERLTEPQLLAYLLAEGGNACALAAVHLSTERIAYRGMSDRPHRLPRLPALCEDESAAAAAWQDQIRRWQALLERLAGDFLAGSATVDPAESACRICHLHTFCRIGEIRAASAGGLRADAPESRDD